MIVPPLRPELQIVSGNRQGSFEIDQKIELKCIARDGRPAAKLLWLLDGEPLFEGVGQEEVIESLNSNNQTLYTATQTLTRYIRAGDDRRTVTCRSTHPSRTLENNLQFSVKCEYITNDFVERGQICSGQIFIISDVNNSS